MAQPLVLESKLVQQLQDIDIARQSEHSEDVFVRWLMLKQDWIGLHSGKAYVQC